MYKVVIELKNGGQWNSENLNMADAIVRLTSLCLDHAGWFSWIQIEPAEDYSGRQCEYDGWC
jgi:hypothetical protein